MRHGRDGVGGGGALADQRASRISHHRCTWDHVLRHDGAHPDRRSLAYAERMAGSTLPDNRAGPHVDVILYHNIPIAPDAWSESHEVSNDAVMFNVGI